MIKTNTQNVKSLVVPHSSLCGKFITMVILAVIANGLFNIIINKQKYISKRRIGFLK